MFSLLHLSLQVIQDVPTRWNSSFYMLQRLVALKVHITAVLVDSVLTPSESHRALLLKQKYWSLAEELVKVLGPAEKATSLLSGQQYVTASCTLPIVTAIVRSTEAHRERIQADETEEHRTRTAAQEHRTRMAADRTKHVAMKSFCKDLAQNIRLKFQLDPVDECSLPTVAASLDPRSKSLTFLPSTDARDGLKLELLRRCSQHILHTELEVSEVEVIEPAAKRIPPNDLDLFFGGADDPEVSASVAIQQEVE